MRRGCPAVEILVSRIRAARGRASIVTAIKTHGGIGKVIRMAAKSGRGPPEPVLVGSKDKYGVNAWPEYTK